MRQLVHDCLQALDKPASDIDSGETFEHSQPACMLFFFFVFVVTGELSTLRQATKVLNEPSLRQNNMLILMLWL